MNSYFRRRTRLTSNPPPPPPARGVVRRTRYEDRNRSLPEGGYFRSGSTPNNPPVATARGLDYHGQGYGTNQAPRAAAPAVDTGRPKPEPYKPILTEKESDYEEKLEPNTNKAVAKTTAHDESQQED